MSKGRIIIVLALAFLGASTARAQTVVNTIPQATRQRAFTAAVAPATFNIRNIGQTNHLLNYTFTGTGAAVQRLLLRLEASNDNGVSWFPISFDGAESLDASGIAESVTGAVFASGYYSQIRANLIVNEGTVTADYSGTSSSPPPTGNLNPGQFSSRLPFNNYTIVAGLNTRVVAVPYGNAAGVLTFTANAVVGATCNIQIRAISESAIKATAQGPLLAASAVATTQVYNVAPEPAYAVRISFVSCTVGDVYTLSYDFVQPVVSMKSKGQAPAIAGQPPQFEADFNCSQSTPISFVAGGAGDTQILAAPVQPASFRRICHISVALSAAVAVKITSGTCAAAPNDVTGPYQNVTALALDFGSAAALRINGSRAICLNVSGAATVGGVLVYAEF